jgi:hypothetical protein
MHAVLSGCNGEDFGALDAAAVADHKLLDGHHNAMKQREEAASDATAF